MDSKDANHENTTEESKTETPSCAEPVPEIEAPADNTSVASPEALVEIPSLEVSKSSLDAEPIAESIPSEVAEETSVNPSKSSENVLHVTEETNGNGLHPEGGIDEDEETDLSIGNSESDEDPSDAENVPRTRKIKRGRGSSRYYTGKSNMDDDADDGGDEEEEGDLETVPCNEGSEGEDDRRNEEDNEEDDDAEEDGGKPSKTVDDDQDKRKPQYIPKSGPFYQHDTREDDENAVSAEANIKDIRNRRVIPERWSHDKYEETNQAPKTTEDLIAQYGYDIRRDEGPPKGHRQRKYGRGPAKYERKWEDPDAYRKSRGGGGPGGPPRSSGGLWQDRDRKSEPNRRPAFRNHHDDREVQKSSGDDNKQSWPTPEEASVGKAKLPVKQRLGRIDNSRSSPPKTDRRSPQRSNEKRDRDERPTRPFKDSRDQDSRPPRRTIRRDDEEFNNHPRVFTRGGPRGRSDFRDSNRDSGRDLNKDRRDQDRDRFRRDDRGGGGGGRGGRSSAGRGRGGSRNVGDKSESLAGEPQVKEKVQSETSPKTKQQDANRPPRYSSQRTAREAQNRSPDPERSSSSLPTAATTNNAAVKDTAPAAPSMPLKPAAVHDSTDYYSSQPAPLSRDSPYESPLSPQNSLSYSSPTPPIVTPPAAALLPTPGAAYVTATGAPYMPTPPVPVPMVYPTAAGAPPAPFPCPPPASMYPRYGPGGAAAVPVAVPVPVAVGGDGPEIYSNGMTYYDTHAQFHPRPIQKRPKAAIPIVAPPERDGNFVDGDDGSQ